MRLATTALANTVDVKSQVESGVCQENTYILPSVSLTNCFFPAISLLPNAKPFLAFIFPQYHTLQSDLPIKGQPW